MANAREDLSRLEECSGDVERLLKRAFIWIAVCHTNPNAPHAHMNLRTDF